MANSTRTRRTLLLASAILLAVSTPLWAQQGAGGGATGFGGGGGAGGQGGGGGATGFGGGAGGAGGAGGQAGGAAGGNAFAGSLGFTGTGAELTSGRSTAVNASNIFSTYYGNPYAVVSTQTTGSRTTIERANAPFGQALYPITATRGNTGPRGTATIGGGRRAGTATVGSGGQGDYTIPGNMGSVVPHIATVVQFKVPTPSADQLLGEIRGIIERSSSVPSKAGVTVSVEGRNVILRGKVASDEERRHIHALLRLTPGLGEIRNELTAPDG